MAVTTTLASTKVYVVLNKNGANSGTINLSLGSLNKAAFDADKAMAIVGLLSPCLEKTVARVEKADVSTLTSSN